ncbi:MarR family transcriptional regulator [Bacillus amyloliquefaciens]|uniref:MarR family winged helix-turn-helix transcriptional regulator n=1 Tax=Bacillus amyloliquefaciens TaxID=1390 RepID=UPI000F630E16|nr:MarR family transcriptional regulator [Bacillus amyloliquefaciens]QBG55113.1 MarR family transcriptional regulator [Bacillus amyloliquefaciens]
MELRHLPDYSQIAGHAEIYADMDAESLKTFLTLLDMSKKMNQVMEHYFSSHGLSEGKFKILMFLFDAPGHSLSPTELAKESNVTKATITGLIDGLARDGFVNRRRHTGDRRKISIDLTEEGKEKLMRFLPSHFSKISGAMESFTAEEKAELTKMLEVLFDKLLLFSGGRT